MTPLWTGQSLRRWGRNRASLLCILLLATGLRLLYVGAPLLDAHRWRQVDTAAIARAFYEGSINALKPEANWGGARGYVESEFPLLPAAAAVLYRLFGPDEIWGRLIVILFSVASVLLVWMVTRDMVDEAAGLAAALLVAVSPGAVFYGRTFMPDSIMVCGSLGALAGYLRYLLRGSIAGLVFGSVSLALAILVKLPGVIVLAPLAAMMLRARGWAFLRDRRLLLAVAIPLALSVAWYAHAYALYLETGLTFGVFGTTKTYPLTVAPGPWGTAFSKWSTLELLTSWEFYQTMLSRVYFLHLTPPGFVLAGIGLLVLWRTRWHGVADAWLLSLLVFIAAAGYGHMGHDYYQLPIVPIGAIYFGSAARAVFDPAWIARTVGPGRLPRIVVFVLVLLLAIPGFVLSGVIERHFRPASLDYDMLRAGEAIDRAAEDGALLAVVDDYGVNSPILLYFARARGWSFDAETIDAHVLRGLERQGARYFATTRWSDVESKQPLLAAYLQTRAALPLDGAPRDTVLFDLTGAR